MEPAATCPVEQITQTCSVEQITQLSNFGCVIMNEMRGERLQVMLSPEELALVDDFRFKHRMPTRAAAVRELLKHGLGVGGTDGASGVKSSNYGVFNRGPDGHTQSGPDAAE